MDRLLVFADDHSEGADTAWAWVCAQSWPGWRAEILTVVDTAPPSEASDDIAEWKPATPRTAPPAAGFASLRHMRAVGDPRSVLSAVPADLLVIGPRGAGFAKKLRLGSVAEWLLHCPQAPLLIAKSADRVERVVLAVDGSRDSLAAAEFLASLPWAALVHVDVVSVDVGDGTTSVGVEEAAALLRAGCPDLAVTVIRPHEWDLTVNVRADLLRFLEEHPGDLLIMGTRGLQGWKRVSVGSTADYLAHHVDRPVLLLRCRQPA
jgi:nucleotide-binding universal stress UspA family protein